MMNKTGWPLSYNKKYPGVFQEFSRRNIRTFQEKPKIKLMFNAKINYKIIIKSVFATLYSTLRES